ncbi:MAG TPA: NAD(P)-binding domain-containing protein [Legionellaceae bacterium]|nr:NAD(P)-binding domain-containing protein [Legionellaceae bacterium]
MKTIYQWAIIGAGPAGIAAVGKLLDHGIAAHDILWLDPYFKVGDLGRLWKNVSSNTQVKLFTDFLNNTQSFLYHQSPDFKLKSLPPKETCTLKYMVEPLQWVTDHLCERVNAEKSTIKNMALNQHVWSLHEEARTFHARNVILATGAVPLNLDYPELDVIPFETAIDKALLSQIINPDKTYGVFGSSHSAIIIIRYLVELGVKKVINFYRSPCRYAIELDDWILFDNTGLKGQTADWARQYIDGVWPKNLVRHNSNEANLLRYLPDCHQVIYAVGFNARHMISMGDYAHFNYHPYTGIIGPGLFGVGIGYPEKKQTPLGDTEWQVGLWKFIQYINKIMPIWFQYHT